MTSAKHLPSIAETCSLTALPCKVFGKDVLYLFYGSAFYRPKAGSTEDRAALPILFLFSPVCVPDMDTFYPFDTGAMASQRYGEAWSRLFIDFRDLACVPGDGTDLPPRKIVQALYGSNTNYLNGRVRAPDGDTLSHLRVFLGSDTTSLGADQRQWAIECQMFRNLRLNLTLDWVAFPEEATQDFLRLVSQLSGHVPKLHIYRGGRRFDAAQVAHELDQAANRRVQDFLLNESEWNDVVSL